MKRGEIYYIQRPDTYGGEIAKSRPAVIVSNDIFNTTSTVIEVVYLTTQPKRDLPTHAHLASSGRESTALCEQIDTVSIKRVGHYCGKCTPDEMAAIDRALEASLDLTRAMDKAVADTLLRLSVELNQVKAERDRYAKMLDKLLGGTR